MYINRLQKALRVTLLPLAFACVGIMRLLAHFGVLVRIGMLYPRLGHAVMNTEVYLCERRAGLHPKWSIDFWTFKGDPASVTHARLLRRCLLIDRTWFTRLVALVNSLFVGWERFTAQPEQLDRDIHNLLERHPPHLRLTEREVRRGYRQLAEWGLPPGARIVCLMVRDAAYLPQLAYHSYRDADVDTYEAAARALAARGYYVFRMGSKVAKKFQVQHPRVIDFAGDGRYSDFMSIWLAAHCSFVISTSTGWDALALAFRKPILYTNFVPFEYLSTFWPRSLAIWKHHYKDGRRLSPAEILASGVSQAMTAQEFTDAGIELHDNTPAELRDAALEMADYVEGRFRPEEQQAFWDAFPRAMSPYNNRPLHGEIRLRVGSRFLEDYRKEEQCLKAKASSA